MSNEVMEKQGAVPEAPSEPNEATAGKEKTYTLKRNSGEWTVVWQTKTRGKSVKKDDKLIARLTEELEKIPKRTVERKKKQAELDLAESTILSADEYPTIKLESLMDASLFFGGENSKDPVQGENEVILDILQTELNLMAQKFWDDCEEDITAWLEAMAKGNMRKTSTVSLGKEAIRLREKMLLFPKGSKERAEAKAVYDEALRKFNDAMANEE